MEPEKPPERQQSRAIYLLPNLLTTGCLFSGFYAVVASIDGNFRRAGFAIFVAMIFDTLDGRIARLTRSESAFGKEYDSLADMVSFGLAPAIVAYQWGVERLFEYGKVWGRLGWLAAFFYAVCAALRLARFNTRDAADKRWFEGLPSPSAAAVVAGFVWASTEEWRGEPGLIGLIVALLVTAAAGGLMVSSFKYSSFKQLNWDGPVKFATIVLVPLSFVLIAFHPPLSLLLVFGGYALSGPVLWAVHRRRKRVAQIAASAANPANPANPADQRDASGDG
ncbi:MAG: CDP-diacylglycerol--serine O-phosphatidyltransferase [Nevskiaceae bacterium]|jgi:CDP-diacylglycerol--serine O-phosphatidyltransferase|nr:CDP-diacylglycerol--serine O-phosphatidyltransferase [Nevskiaceae bacterium]